MEDGLEELFLGEPAMFVAPPVEITGGGGEHQRGYRERTYRHAAKGYRQRGAGDQNHVFNEMLSALNKALDEQKDKDVARDKSLSALQDARLRQEIDRYFSPPEGPPMTRADKQRLEEREILRKSNAMVNRQMEQAALAKKIAMNIKMARVRAAKKK